MDKTAYGKTKPEFDGNYVYTPNLKKGTKVWYGGNLFAILTGQQTTYEKECIVMSPNSRSKATSELYTNTNALRDISKLRYQVKDATKTTIFSKTYKNIPKTRRNADGSSQSIEERLGDLERFVFDCRDTKGAVLADGTYTLSISAAPAGLGSGAYTKTTSYPITIDSRGPVVNPKKNTLTLQQDTLQLQVNVSDAYALSGVQVVDAQEKVVWSQVIDAKKSFAQTFTLGTIEELKAQGVDVDHLSLVVYDYAMNHTIIRFVCCERAMEFYREVFFRKRMM